MCKLEKIKIKEITMKKCNKAIKMSNKHKKHFKRLKFYIRFATDLFTSIFHNI